MSPAAEQQTPNEQDTDEFRFFDNRQKYLLFVNTCSEKWVIGERIAREFKTHCADPAVDSDF